MVVENQQGTFFRVKGKSGVSRLSIELISGEEAIWQAMLDDVKALSVEFADENTAGKNAMLDELTRQIDGLTTPYFVPQDSNQATLPVVLR